MRGWGEWLTLARADSSCLCFSFSSFSISAILLALRGVESCHILSVVSWTNRTALSEVSPVVSGGVDALVGAT